jgi:hypothetical protein
VGNGRLALRFRQWKLRRRSARALREYEHRVNNGHRSDRPHGLPRPLVVSLTSFPPRFPVLEKTLNCLLLQSIRPDHVVLWLAHDDLAKLPDSILKLRALGLEIRGTADLRSFTKIIPTLDAFPDAFVVTADDDVYYWPTWLEELVDSHRRTGDPVICHRGHQIRLGKDGLPVPYNRWHRGTRRSTVSPLLFPTGVMGVFYDPRIFHSDINRPDLFQHLCPMADDVWIYWMHRLNGATPRLLPCRHRVLEWPGGQEQNLRSSNVGQSGNDVAIKQMIQHYWWPT